jgi:hypothetical protein
MIITIIQIRGSVLMVTEAAQRKKCNAIISKICSVNHNNLSDPIKAIAKAIEVCEFSSEPMNAIYCGRDGRMHDQVGKNTWLMLTWHKISDYPHERWEINAYVS